MVQKIMKDEAFLSQASTAATEEDKQVAQDLLDTIAEFSYDCVGMAANMIGVLKRVIVIENQETGDYQVMYNPEILKASDRYQTEEGCLSLIGGKKTMRYEKIKLQYQNEEFQVRIKTFTGFTAQIIQHQIDHCNGVVI